jgi:hypothetical protein
MLEIDYSKYNATVARVIDETGRTGGDVVRQFTKLFVGDAIKLTPPTGNAPFTENLNDQKKAGEMAVKNDINRGFTEIESLGIVKDPDNKVGQSLKRYARRQEFGKLETLIKRIGFKGKFAAFPTPRRHLETRDRYGRVRKGKDSATLIMRTGSVAPFIKQVQRLVGRAKAGWGNAARALGLPIPQWIARHAEPGEVIDESRNLQNPSMTVSNHVPFAQHHNRTNQIIQRALNHRAEAFEHQLNASLGKTFDGYSK